MERKHLAILFGAVKSDQRSRFANLIEGHRGKILKTVGEAILAGFTESRPALESALSYQSHFPTWRAGIADGEVTISPNEVLGDAANLAARLEGLAAPGDIYVTESVRWSSEGISATPVDLGARPVKGLPQPIRLFAYRNKPSSAADLFDFSRVEYERIQSAPSTTTGSFAPPREESIPLANEVPIQLAYAPPRPATPSARSTSRRNEERSKELKRALGIFLLWAVALPAILIGAGWGYHHMKATEEREKEEYLRRKLESSEVLKLMKSPRSTAPTSITEPAEEPKAAILVRTEPRVAEIYVEGKLVGRDTPFRITDVPANRMIRVRISKTGYEDSIQLLNLAPNEDKELYVELIRKK